MDARLPYSIFIDKEYLNFSSAHFMIFSDGSREPLHGHNYRVELKGEVSDLDCDDMAFDFRLIKPLVRKICNELDHKLLLPGENARVVIDQASVPHSILYSTPDGDKFTFPAKDCLVLPLKNISAEWLAFYFHQKIKKNLKNLHDFSFISLEVGVEECPGQMATYKGETA